MFSSRPSIASKSAAALDSLSYACSSVAEQCLYAVVEPSSRAQFRARVADEAGGTPWLCATVGFRDALDGTLTITMPAAAVAEWCGGFTGTEPDAAIADAQADDFAAELANMVCGSWLTQASGRRLFALDAPRVTRLDEAALRDVGADDGDGVLYLCINDVPVRLELTITAEAAR
jgi:hypothetical protein